MNAIEPLADITSAGIAARAIEPATGLDRSGHTAEQLCLNCGTALIGTYCHGCGQRGHVHRTLGAFFHDLVHGVLHFEGKVFHTLPKLMLRPGELTRRYIAGERARFVSPLALFLFSVFTMFAVVSLLGSPMDMISNSNSAEAATEVESERAKLMARLAELRQARAAAVAKGQGTKSLDEDIRKVESGLQVLDVFRVGTTTESFSVKQDAATPNPQVKLGDANILGFEPDSALDVAYGQAKSNPGLLIYKLQTNAYKFSWALIVISVPFMALLFLWRRRPFYDHAVFVTYSITAVSMLVILGSLLILAGLSASAVMMAAALLVPWHMYRQLRGAYGLGRISALWRTVALLFFANMALSLFSLGLLMMGVLG
jgi:hypothetical protein